MRKKVLLQQSVRTEFLQLGYMINVLYKALTLMDTEEDFINYSAAGRANGVLTYRSRATWLRWLFTERRKNGATESAVCRCLRLVLLC